MQLGKDDGDGPDGTVHRFLRAIDGVKQRAKDLRRIGVPIGPLYVLGLGDLIESCDGHYPMQSFRVSLDRREQVKIARRLIVRAVREWAPLFPRVVVGAVGGNHGENRRDGKAFTTFADNDDVALFEMAQEVFTENAAAFGHVSWQIPKDELTLTLDVCGTVVGVAHGHQAKSSGNPISKLQTWWRNQAHGRQPIGQAQILLSGHYHHLVVNQTGAKTHIQCPALEGGSDWWTHQTGQSAPKGLLTLVIGRACGPAGWDHLRVIA